MNSTTDGSQPLDSRRCSGMLGLLLGIAMKPSRPAVTFSVKSRSHLGTRQGSDYSVQTGVPDPVPTSVAGHDLPDRPDAITENGRLRSPNQHTSPIPHKSIWISWRAVDRTLWWLAIQNGPMIDCSAIVQKLDNRAEFLATVQITRSGIQ